ncbi:MAG: hypothetical protein J1E63_01150 [Muribaculaceae bacterium]|nr:hypothetical protein [Muribaculaceae bacterium]
MEDIRRDSFVFYRSFVEILEMLGPEDAKRYAVALGRYALDEEEPELEGLTKMLWVQAKPQLDANLRRSRAGRRGGAPKGSSNNPRGRAGNSNPIEEPQNEPTSPTPPSTPPSPQAPTIREVVDHFTAAGCAYKGEEFFHYYDARGWRINDTPITSWKAVAKSWIAKSNPAPAAAPVDPKLGVGETRDANGVRIYGLSKTPVPEDAPPRPGAHFWWNKVTQMWDDL